MPDATITEAPERALATAKLPPTVARTILQQVIRGPISVVVKGLSVTIIGASAASIAYELASAMGVALGEAMRTMPADQAARALATLRDAFTAGVREGYSRKP